jgi:hypothetical protein
MLGGCGASDGSGAGGAMDYGTGGTPGTGGLSGERSMTAGSGGTMMGTGGDMMGSGGMMMGMGGEMLGSGGTMMGTGGEMMGSGGMMMGTGGEMMGSGGTMMGMGGERGPDSGSICRTPGTIAVKNSGMSAYVMDGQSNPTLTLCRGSTYTFAIDAPGHPFYIKTIQGTGTDNAYSTGVTGNGATVDDVVFVVPADAPDTLYYNCSFHAAMTGTIHIVH